MEFLTQATIDATFAKHRLRYVVFKDLYRNFWRPEVQALFGKIAALKLAGYRSKHQDGVLPLDSVDFVGTHVLICRENDDGSLGDPLAGFKSVSLKTCDQYQLGFPVQRLLETCNPPVPVHQKKLLSLMQRARTRDENLYYNGAWTIAPETRNDSVLREVLIQGSYAMLGFYYVQAERVPVLAAAVVRFGVDQNKLQMGYHDFVTPFEARNEFIYSPLYSGNQLRLMRQEVLNAEGEFLLSLFQQYWDRRFILGDVVDEAVRAA